MVSAAVPSSSRLLSSKRRTPSSSVSRSPFRAFLRISDVYVVNCIVMFLLLIANGYPSIGNRAGLVPGRVAIPAGRHRSGHRSSGAGNGRILAETVRDEVPAPFRYRRCAPALRLWSDRAVPVRHYAVVPQRGQHVPPRRRRRRAGLSSLPTPVPGRRLLACLLLLSRAAGCLRPAPYRL